MVRSFEWRAKGTQITQPIPPHKRSRSVTGVPVRILNQRESLPLSKILFDLFMNFYINKYQAGKRFVSHKNSDFTSIT